MTSPSDESEARKAEPASIVDGIAALPIPDTRSPQQILDDLIDP